MPPNPKKATGSLQAPAPNRVDLSPVIQRIPAHALGYDGRRLDRMAECVVCRTPMIVWRPHGLPDAELLMFPSAAHEILREEDAVRLAAHERIDAFLDARAPAAR